MKMLGVMRQPYCGKCCGEKTKRGNMTQKRAQRRFENQRVKETWWLNGCEWS